MDVKVQKFTLTYAINEHATATLTLPQGVTYYCREAMAQEKTGTFHLNAMFFFFSYFLLFLDDASEGILRRDLLLRTAELYIQDSLQRTRTVLTARLSLSIATALHTLSPLDLRVDVKLSSMLVTVNAPQLAVALQQQQRPTPRRKTETAAFAPEINEFDKVFPTLPFEFVRRH